MESLVLGWPALGAAFAMIGLPALVTIRRSAGRPVRFVGRAGVPVPWWAHALGLAGVVLGAVTTERLAERGVSPLAVLGLVVVFALLVAGSFRAHNRRAAAGAAGGRPPPGPVEQPR